MLALWLLIVGILVGSALIISSYLIERAKNKAYVSKPRIEVDKDEARKYEWHCSNNNSNENHFEINDELVTCEDFDFVYCSLKDSYVKTIKIKEGTIGYVTNIWNSGTRLFVDIKTQDGISLNNIPYHLLEFSENTPAGKDKQIKDLQGIISEAEKVIAEANKQIQSISNDKEER